MSRAAPIARVRTPEQERSVFALRLQLALAAAGVPVSATRVQQEFNARSGQPAITAHAARKWIMGESIPTQERMRVLAAWLGVTASWLRFGDVTAEQALSELSAQEQLLIKNYRKLGTQERRQVLALIVTMAGKRGD